MNCTNFSIHSLIYFIWLFVLINPFLSIQAQDDKDFQIVRVDTKAQPQKIKAVQIENNSNTVARCIFKFGHNGFHNEESLKELILKEINNKKSGEENQLLILQNIAGVIKNPAHRNLHLLFTSATPSVSLKKYSPLAMITSFYDKQCYDYQRLAAQLALLSGYFRPTDFKNYNILQHNVLEVKIGQSWVFHDFDPGQPGFRFFKNDKKEYASVEDLINNNLLIDKNQFYTYNGVNLCPWITEAYYRTLFSKIYGQNNYPDLDKVYGFIPQWTIPPQSMIKIDYLETSTADKFGIKVFLDKKDQNINKTFKSYEKYLKSKNARDSIKTNNALSKYMKQTFNYNLEINYVYLISAGIIELADSSYIQNSQNEFFIKVIINTGKDTLWFPDNYLIPLPLYKINVQRGLLVFFENEQTTKGWAEKKYIVKDSIAFNLFNFEPPVMTSEESRRTPDIEAPTLIYGPSNGYILPHSFIEMKYYYNPYYYNFFSRGRQIIYDNEYKGRIYVRFILENQ